MSRPERKAPCTVDIVPFDCKKKTCECDLPGDLQTIVSENCLIRYDARPAGTAPDELRLIFKSTLPCNGMLVVFREADVPVLETPIQCRTTLQCVSAMGAHEVGRPPIRMEDGTGAMTPDEAFMRLQAWGAPQNPIPDVRPYSNREKYLVFVSCCNNQCNDRLAATGWDCDLILLAYQMLYMAGVSFDGVLAGVDTIRQFFARMAIRGAKALCDLYQQSATRCERRFHDVNAATCISAVLAEETWLAQVKQLRGQPLSPGWQAYYDQANLRMNQLDLVTFQRYSAWFGDAHLTEGLIKSLNVCGASPCRAHDLDLVVETLASAQVSAITEAVGALTVGMLGTTVADQFKREMRDRILSALDQAGDTSTANELRQQWQTP